jgi:hypothetical protein
MSNMGTSIAPDIRRRRPSPYRAPDRKKIGREISRFKPLGLPQGKKKFYFSSMVCVLKGEMDANSGGSEIFAA